MKLVSLCVSVLASQHGVTFVSFLPCKKMKAQAKNTIGLFAVVVTR